MINWKTGDIAVLDNGALARCLHDAKPGLWQVGSPYNTTSMTAWIDQHHPVRLVREPDMRDKIADEVQALEWAESWERTVAESIADTIREK